ncbi:MAG: C25 family cysteine peptidase [Candidatus Spyradenecus sp.]
MNRNCFFAFVVVMGCGQAWAATQTVALDALPAIELVREGETASLRAEGLERPLEPVGAPSLPYYTVRLEVSAEAEVGAVTLEGEWKTLGEGVTLEPIQPVYVMSETPEQVGPDPTLYAKAWPEAAVENLGITRSLGKRTLHLKVTPVRYAEGKVEVLTQGSVSVEVTEPAATPRLKSAALLTAEASPTPARRYILISPPAYTTQWQDYIDARAEQRPDVTFVLKDAAEIYSTYPFNTDNTNGSPRNPAESIHQFLREDVTANPAGTTYVVLGGSWVDAWNITSADDATLQTKIPGIIAKPAAVYNQYPLTDMFYACLNVGEGKYPWDGNANKNYADGSELGNSANDYDPDIIVSRIPLSKSGRAETTVIADFTAKVARAEAADFPGRHRYYSAGGQLDTTYSASSGYFLRAEQEFYDGGLNQFDPARSSSFVDCEVVPRRSMKSLLATRRPVFGGNPLFPYSWGADFATQNAAISDFYTANREYTEYRDHGSSQSLYGGFVTVARHLTGTGLSRIILAGYSCQTGRIDIDEITLAEAEIVSAQGGTVASVHNSRFGLSYAGRGAVDQDNLSSTLQYKIKEQLMNSDCDLGTAWLNSRKSYCSNTWGQARFAMFEQLLLGDPLIALPPAVEEATWTGSEDCSQDLGYTSLTATVGTTIESAKLVKVMQGLTVTGSGDFTFAADGGVGSGVTFSETGTHALTLASPSKGYFAQPTGATAVAITGSGITLDLGSTAPTFSTLTLDGGDSRKTGNIIRGTEAGQLASFLPLTVTNTEVLFATRDAFLGAEEGDKITVTNGAVGFLTNPNVGKQYGRWDGFYCPVELTDSSIVVDTTQTAAFGSSSAPGLTIDAFGESAISTIRGGKITLFGTTTVNVHDGATLTIGALFSSFTLDDGTTGKLKLNNSGGTVIVNGNADLAGEVTVNGGTLQLSSLPLANVTKLTLAGEVKLILPKDEGGFYQILPAKGATLDMSGATVSVYTSDALDTPITGAFTSTCAYFDQAAFLVWSVATGTWNTDTSNTPWKLNGVAMPYSSTYRTYFPDVDATPDVSVTVGTEIACDFVNFGNQSSVYTFSGSKLNVQSLQLGTNVNFDNAVYSSAGVLANDGTTSFANLTTPTLNISAGATVSATALSNTMTTIKGIRFYPRVMRGGGSTCSLAELRFYSGSTEVKLSDGTKSDAPGYSSTNQGYLWDGVVSGAEMGFGGERVWQVTAGSAAEFANDQYYLQFMFSTSKSMVTSYKLAGGYNTWQNAPIDFRVDVSPDGISWITVSEVSGARTAGNGLDVLWYLSGACSCSNGGPTAVTVSAGGAYELKGTPNATITCEAGAIFKAVSDSALQYNANCTFVYPEEGTITIDPTALNLADGASALVIANAGKTFTHADLAHFSVPEGYTLVRDANGLNVVKQTTLAGPYRRTLSGRTTWADTGWTADTVTEGGAWSSANRAPCADIELLTTADTVLKITESVTFGTLRQQTLPEGTEGSEVDRSAYANRLRLEKSADATVEAVTYDLSAFEGRVTIAFSTGAATVIAGADTRLRENGTGKLIIGEGMKVTLYAESWGGTIENNGGTIEYRSPMKAPQVQFK